ncbi:hypothetical protein [Streptomyces sp. CMB-StM0423]|uniref:hypothetical protein n=1 Tax=Streptomyces sp. CMB-StM0423 TaxID=2059884 RepID=UPI000C703B28|nr:hypothetical protein [Streptomyces sp. CMB-StM0423]AUH40540.1 hypothetical protein CXR04_10030 [Streptomyces sp. CMB-StM0423]
MARALADQIRPGAAPRDVTVSFGVRRQAAAEYHHRSRGGPVTVFAQALHAALYGLPVDDDPLPTALDELLQATHTATSPEQRTAVLRRLADQLGNAAEIIQRYQYQAQADRLPDDIATQLSDACSQAQRIAEILDRAAPEFSSPPATQVSPGPQSRHAAGPPATPPGHRR